jgi:hypothetical protein
MSDTIPRRTLLNSIQQSRERMLRVEAEIHEMVLRTSAAIEASRRAMADADWQLETKKPEPIRRLVIVQRDPARGGL